MNKGRALELFFIEGDPKGMATAQLVNWTGHVLRVPRNAIKIGLKREEAKRTGCYLLRATHGDDTTLYVGESDCIVDRIRQHDLNKDWWDEVCFITTSSETLHKAHVKYLESKLVEAAKAAGRVILDNGNTPGTAKLSEAITASMEEYLDNLFIALGALGIEDFTSGVQFAKTVEGETQKNEQNDLDKFFLKTPKHGVSGTAYLSGSEFVVCAGSKARREWSSKSGHSYKKTFERLLRIGVLDIEDKVAVFAKDYAFKSPSAAAAVMNGRPANGRIEWKTENGMTFDDWEKGMSLI
ncbi:MAG: GIY-YIG nuclease family protein [Planktomarina sp.]